MSNMKKVIEWVDVSPPRSWQGKLECGHIIGRYDDELGDDQKAAIEATDNQALCLDCDRIESEIERLEEQLRRVKAQRK